MLLFVYHYSGFFLKKKTVETEKIINTRLKFHISNFRKLLKQPTLTQYQQPNKIYRVFQQISNINIAPNLTTNNFQKSLMSHLVLRQRPISSIRVLPMKNRRSFPRKPHGVLCPFASKTREIAKNAVRVHPAGVLPVIWTICFFASPFATRLGVVMETSSIG